MRPLIATLTAYLISGLIFEWNAHSRDGETAFTESLKLKESASVRFYRAEMYHKIGKLLLAKDDYNIVVKLPDVSPLDKSLSISRLTELHDVVKSPPINRYPQEPNYEV